MELLGKGAFVIFFSYADISLNFSQNNQLNGGNEYIILNIN